jgi:hypothetical protein
MSCVLLLLCVARAVRHCNRLKLPRSYGGSLVYDGSLSGGGFVAFCFVAAQVTMAAAAVPMLLADSRRAAAAARRVVDVLQRQPRLPHRGGLTLQSVQGRVTWRGVSLRRPPHDLVVDADVDAPAGAARPALSATRHPARCSTRITAFYCRSADSHSGRTRQRRPVACSSGHAHGVAIERMRHAGRHW